MKKTQREKVRETRSLFDLNDKNKDSILREQMKKMKRQGDQKYNENQNRKKYQFMFSSVEIHQASGLIEIKNIYIYTPKF